MADNTIQLLNNSLQQSQMLYQTVDNQLTKHLQVAQQAGQFEVGMKAKALEFAEQQRINDFKIQEMQAANAMRAKEFEFKKELMPKQLEIQQLNLEAARFNFDKQKEASVRQAFNDITEIEDEASAYSLLQTQSVDQARELIEKKAYWRGKVAQGEPFDPEAYRKEVQEINAKYKDVKPAKAGVFDENIHYLLGEISPKTQKAYELKNPMVAQGRNMFGLAFLDSESINIDDLRKYESLFTPQEWGSMGAAKMLYQTNKQNIPKYYREANELMKLASASLDEEQKAGMQKQASEFIKQAEQAYAKNQELAIQFTSGNFGFSQEEATNAAMLEKPKPLRAEDVNQKPISIAGVKTTGDAEQKAMAQRLNELNRKLGGNENVVADEIAGYADLGVLDLEWYNDRVTGEVDYGALTSIRQRIEQNLEAMDNLDEVIQPVKVNDVLGSLKTEKSVEMSPWLSSIIGLQFGMSEDNPRPALTFGPKRSNMSSLVFGSTISSYDDMMNIVNKIKNPAERKEAKKEIYAAAVAAGVGQSLEN